MARGRRDVNPLRGDVKIDPSLKKFVEALEYILSSKSWEDPKNDLKYSKVMKLELERFNNGAPCPRPDLNPDIARGYELIRGYLSSRKVASWFSKKELEFRDSPLFRALYAEPSAHIPATGGGRGAEAASDASGDTMVVGGASSAAAAAAASHGTAATGGDRAEPVEHPLESERGREIIAEYVECLDDYKVVAISRSVFTVRVDDLLRQTKDIERLDQRLLVYNYFIQKSKDYLERDITSRDFAICNICIEALVTSLLLGLSKDQQHKYLDRFVKIMDNIRKFDDEYYRDLYENLRLRLTGTAFEHDAELQNSLYKLGLSNYERERIDNLYELVPDAVKKYALGEISYQTYCEKIELIRVLPSLKLRSYAAVKFLEEIPVAYSKSEEIKNIRLLSAKNRLTLVAIAGVETDEFVQISCEKLLRNMMSMKELMSEKEYAEYYTRIGREIERYNLQDNRRICEFMSACNPFPSYCRILKAQVEENIGAIVQDLNKEEFAKVYHTIKAAIERFKKGPAFGYQIITCEELADKISRLCEDYEKGSVQYLRLTELKVAMVYLKADRLIVKILGNLKKGCQDDRSASKFADLLTVICMENDISREIKMHFLNLLKNSIQSASEVFLKKGRPSDFLLELEEQVISKLSILDAGVRAGSKTGEETAANITSTALAGTKPAEVGLGAAKGKSAHSPEEATRTLPEIRGRRSPVKVIPAYSPDAVSPPMETGHLPAAVVAGLRPAPERMAVSPEEPVRTLPEIRGRSSPMRVSPAYSPDAVSPPMEMGHLPAAVVAGLRPALERRAESPKAFHEETPVTNLSALKALSKVTSESDEELDIKEDKRVSRTPSKFKRARLSEVDPDSKWAEKSRRRGDMSRS